MHREIRAKGPNVYTNTWNLSLDVLLVWSSLFCLSLTSGCVRPTAQSSAYSDDSGRPGFEGEFTKKKFLTLGEEEQFQAYVRACEKRLGKIPRINCGNGLEIPAGITTHGAFENFDGSKGKYKPSTQEGRVCDRPSFGLSPDLGHTACTPHSRIGRAPAQTGFNTEWIYLCRRYFDREKTSTLFDDISQIGYDRATGATCFFVTKVNYNAPQSPAKDNAIDSKLIPEFTSKESTKYFMSPREMSRNLNCLECHTSHAWIRTPHITQVMNDGKRVLPDVGSKDSYHVVAFNYLEAVGHQPWRPKKLVSPEAKVCTGCHNIGNGFYASYIVPAAFGMTHGVQMDGKNVEWPRFSEHAQKFPMNIHFEFGRNVFPQPKTPEDWEKSRFKLAADFILNCSSEKNQKCDWKE